MESAIPSHLQCPRTRPVRASEDYTPPYPSWVARIDPSVKQVAIAYLGVQYRGTAAQTTARRAILRLKELATRVGGPRHHDVAYDKDGADFDTLVFIAYWSDPIELERWLALPELMQWWADEDRVNEGVGWFREIICPGIDRFETLFSTADSFEGVGVLAKAMSGEIRARREDFRTARSGAPGALGGESPDAPSNFWQFHEDGSSDEFRPQVAFVPRGGCRARSRSKLRVHQLSLRYWFVALRQGRLIVRSQRIRAELALATSR